MGHDLLFHGPTAELFRQTGVIRAARENAAKALATGYVTTAIEAGVPIVPTVSIGAQESQLFLTRGNRVSHALGVFKLSEKIGRSDIMPITFGFPFGFSILMMPINLPLPTKIVTEVLKPIDIKAEFGDHPDIEKIDRRVRSVMQTVLNRMARRRRFPILG